MGHSHIIFIKNDLLELIMKEILKVMKAASDPGRIKILKMLEHKVMCVCEIHTILGMAQSTASKHLKILEEAGLVTSHKTGLWVNFALSDGRQSPYASNLLGNLRHWLNEETEILALIEALPDIDRGKICKK
jgi:ArsR family transcriptional regulator